MDKFEVISGTLVCSDPCYEIPTWCQGIVENVKKGTWEANTEMVNSWGERVAVLSIYHIGSKLNGKWERFEFSAGVDSGQFGFFDKDFYRNDEGAKELKKHDFGDNYDKESGDEWYRACCNITLTGDNWGVLPNGVVSSSGYGDGSYDVFGMKDENDEYIAFSVVFIDEDEEEEEDEWDDCSDEEE